MTSFNPTAYPSMFQIARRGNVRAIACLINSYLAPYGIYVRAQPVHGGCLPLKVEFESLPDQPETIGQMRDRLIWFICHHLWRLNSDVIEGVRIVGLMVRKWTFQCTLASIGADPYPSQSTTKQAAPRLNSPSSKITEF